MSYDLSIFNLSIVMDILVVGSVAFDTITTPFGKADDALGGSATYFSLAAKHFAKPRVVAVVGEDFEDGHLEVFKNHQIDIQGLKKIPGKTFRWGGEYGFDLNNRTTLFTHLNVFESFSPDIPESCQNSEFIFLGNIHPLLQQKVLSQVKKPKLVACDTMNYWIEKSYQELLETLKQVDVLIINDSEARELSKEFNLVKAAKKILGLLGKPEHIPPTVVIKRGEYGVLMFQNNQWFNVPAYPLENVFDPTGAGDSFAGGFVGHLAKCGQVSWDSLKQAAVFGSVTASFCVEKMGTGRLQEIGSDDIKNRFAEFKDLTHFNEI